jgi:hypothetical protein
LKLAAIYGLHPLATETIVVGHSDAVAIAVTAAL